MAISLCDSVNILDKIVLSKHQEQLFRVFLISKFSWGRKPQTRQVAHLINASVIRRWLKKLISPFCILKRLDSLISSVKRWFGRLFQSLMIFTKKEYLRELTLADFICILYGWLALVFSLLQSSKQPLKSRPLILV